jgi:hypothetical protein
MTARQARRQPHHPRRLEGGDTEVQQVRGLVINLPAAFADPAFVAWLNDDRPKFTWHRGGAPTEWSDVVVLVDPSLSGEGTDSDMPEAVWAEILKICRAHLPANPAAAHYAVRLTNLRL